MYSRSQAGKLVWITGLSCAGKTQIAKGLHKLLEHSVHLDGDSLRDILCNKDYSFQGRKELAFQYARLANYLANQGHVVIVSTISLWHDVQEYNRKNNANYLEVLITASSEELKRRGREKGDIYKPGALDVWGVDHQPEYPRQPSLILVNDTPSQLQQNIKTLKEAIMHGE